MKRELGKITLTTIILMMILSTIPIPMINAEPKTIRVPQDYQTIQEAIDAAENGDTILISSGIYYENLLVNKAVFIMGVEKYLAIIDGNKTGTVIQVTTNNVEISNLTIQNPGYVESCIELNDVSNCRILYNKVDNHGHHGTIGIKVIGTSILNNISWNTIKNNTQGILIDSLPNYNTISGNFLIGNLIGIEITGSYNNVTGNIFNGGETQIGVGGSHNNVSFNSHLGLEILKGYAIFVSGTANYIWSNYITESFKGIYISGNNHTIKENTIYNSTGPITLINSKYCLVWNNTIRNRIVGWIFSGISIRESSYNSIIANTVENITWGINILSGKNVFLNNTLIDNIHGIYLNPLYPSNNHTICYNNFVDNEYGIYAENTAFNNITENSFHGNEYGVYLANANYHTIQGNSFYANTYAIFLTGSLFKNMFNTISNNALMHGGYGIYSNYGLNNTISGNTIDNNNNHGIRLSDTQYYIISENTIVENNNGIHMINCHNNSISDSLVLENNGDGLHLQNSTDNIFHNNTVTGNYGYGMWCWFSSNNTIYHNDFNNTNQAYIHESSNIWDDGYPSGGNYWSDYIGVDEFSGPNQNINGSDGIGDTPYIIDEFNKDNYPLISTPSSKPIVDMELSCPKTELGYHVTNTTVTIRITNYGNALAKNVSMLVVMHHQFNTSDPKTWTGDLKPGEEVQIIIRINVTRCITGDIIVKGEYEDEDGNSYNMKTKAVHIEVKNFIVIEHAGSWTDINLSSLTTEKVKTLWGAEDTAAALWLTVLIIELEIPEVNATLLLKNGDKLISWFIDHLDELKDLIIDIWKGEVDPVILLDILDSLVLNTLGLYITANYRPDKLNEDGTLNYHAVWPFAAIKEILGLIINAYIDAIEWGLSKVPLSSNFLILEDKEGTLYLEVYDSQGNEQKVYYYENFAFASINSTITEFTFVVNGTEVEKAEEIYSLMYLSVRNETIVDQKNITDTIHQGENQEFKMTLDDEGKVEFTLRSYSISWDDQIYEITILSNSTVCDFKFNETGLCYIFNGTGLNGTIGFCEVTIPNTPLIGPYTVYINGIITTVDESSNETHTIMNFVYSHGAMIEIRGTGIIPEFNYSVVLMLLMLLIAVALIILKKKSSLIILKAVT